jgi:hypothetical protein
VMERTFGSDSSTRRPGEHRLRLRNVRGFVICLG